MADKVSAYSWPSPWVLGNIPRLPIFSPILLLALEGRYRGILGLIIRRAPRLNNDSRRHHQQGAQQGLLGTGARISTALRQSQTGMCSNVVTDAGGRHWMYLAQGNGNRQMNLNQL